MILNKVDISVFVHATEDIDSVKKCVENLLEDVENIKFNVSGVTGGYGNPIKILTVSINNKKQAEKFVRSIGSRLSDYDRKKITRELKNRIAKGSELHMRFKKSDLYFGRLALYDQSDVIKIVLHFIRYNRKNENNISSLFDYLSHMGIIEPIYGEL